MSIKDDWNEMTTEERILFAANTRTEAMKLSDEAEKQGHEVDRRFINNIIDEAEGNDNKESS